MTSQEEGRPWPWALGVVIVPSAVVDRRRVRELRLAVVVEAYKLGLFLVDVLTVSAEHAAIDVDDVRVMARRATTDTLLVLDTCAGWHLLDLAMPDGLTVRPVRAASARSCRAPSTGTPARPA
jgi:hypothetical protein